MVDATYQRHDPSTGLTIVKVDESKLDEKHGTVLRSCARSAIRIISQGDPVVASGRSATAIRCVRCGDFGYKQDFRAGQWYNLLTTDILGSTDSSGILVNLVAKSSALLLGYSARNNVVTGIAFPRSKS